MAETWKTVAFVEDITLDGTSIVYDFGTSVISNTDTCLVWDGGYGRN